MTTTRSGFTKLAAICIAILLGAVIWELGWPLTHAEHEWSRLIAAVATLGHLTGVLGSFFRKEINRPSLRLLIFQIICCLLIFLLIAREQQEDSYMRFTELSRLVITAGLIAIPTLMSLTRIFEWLLGKQKKGRPLMAPAMQFVTSLGVVILAGTGLLLLPNSTYPGITLSFTDALFTSTSAVCVTGLNAVDFASTFTPLGEMFTLALIQIGGFGIMTFAYFVAMVAGQGFSLRDRVLLTDLLDEGNLGSVVSFITTIVVSTLFIELCGAVLLYFSWEGKDINLMGEPLWWHSLFHSVSAFCNAGFDILGRADAPYPSLTAYAADPLVNIVIMLLIIVGGIGFLTWDDVCTHGLHLRRYRMQSKVILSATALLITIPAVLFYLTDFADLPVGERILASLFQSVTPRTAGYNTVDLTEMTDASQAVTILLMLTGGAPGSTAGGMKVTTLAVLIANAVAAFRRREDPQLFHRRLETSTVRNAAAILLLYLGLTFAGAAVISTAEELPLGACLYETASAAGTVGLTLGLTPQLGVLSQSILILLMYFGRVGGLTLIYAAFSGHDLTYARYPQEKITVG